LEIKATARASKPFFVSMITRDISLTDCILDLIDNSVDAIENHRSTGYERQLGELKYSGYKVKVEFSKDHFLILDESGGISLDSATNYAFRFGRDDDNLPDEEEPNTIGYYGIGMKRAFFKLGNKINLISSTGIESFEIDLDVSEWLKIKDPDWNFTLHNVIQANTTVPQGTKLYITELNTNISRQFESPTFESAFRKILERDYAFILSQGLEVEVNGQMVGARLPVLKANESLKPYHDSFEVEGVQVKITAGIGESPVDDSSAEGRYPNIDFYGWYVVCNDRVVVAGDKGVLTGWGTQKVPTWHPQYYGFVGIVEFIGRSGELPWITTKRGVDTTHPAYVKALNVMRNLTKTFAAYTNKRKKNVGAAKKIERTATPIPFAEIAVSKQLVLPAMEGEELVRIEFKKPKNEVDALSKALNLSGASPTEVGMRAFEYAMEREV
jgi:hypothetical protein